MGTYCDATEKLLQPSSITISRADPTCPTTCSNLSNAFDKDLQTRLVSISNTTQSNKNGTVWISLKFERIVFVSYIVFHHRYYMGWPKVDDVCISGKRAYKECIDNSSKVLIRAVLLGQRAKFCGNVELGYSLYQNDQVYDVPCNVVLDEIFLHKKKGNIEIYEMEIHGHPCGKQIICKKNNSELCTACNHPIFQVN